MGYMLAVAVLVATFGRAGDIFGRVKMYNLGFLVFTVGAVAASSVWSTGDAGALELIIMRMVQAVGGALMMANSAAILTDAFPSNQRGLAMGVNQITGFAGIFIGIIVGGVLAQFDWRLVFLFNVPLGLLGTVWSYISLKEIGTHIRNSIDWLGNLLFAGGLATILIGITYGIEPYGKSSMGWANPFVISMISTGLALLILFVFSENKVKEPMFRLHLFSIWPFTAANISAFLAAVGRGGLMFILVMWLQGIWLPQHGYAFSVTPLWAGIYMIPLTIGFIVAGPVSGKLSDRFGARPFATGGMLLAALTFLALLIVPANFSYPLFALIIFGNGIAMGLFASPNTAALMNSVPSSYRGAASGMWMTFQNAGMPLSIGVFFTLMIVGLNATVPHAMLVGLVSHGVAETQAAHLANLPPLGYLFAAFMGYNPLKSLLGPAVLSHLTHSQAALVESRYFFPQLISNPFHHGLVLTMSFAAAACLIAAFFSWSRGGHYVHEIHAEHGIKTKVRT